MNLRERFWSKVDVLENVYACWLWTASRYPAGYGRFALTHGSNVPAHRVAWLLATGDLPPELDVLHSCDNPPCCNPGHLFLGTHSDNMRDMFAKSRHPIRRGTEQPGSKLDEADVRQIRELYANGSSQSRIAKDFGVSQQVVSGICRGALWKHVE